MQLELPLAPAQAPPGATRSISLGDANIAYRFRRSRRRSIGLAVDEHGLRVTAPWHAPLHAIEACIRQRSAWIIDKLSWWRRAPRPARIEWRAGERLPLLGRAVSLEFVAGRDDLQLRDDRLSIGLVAGEAPAAARTRAIAWIKGLALSLLTERIKFYAPLLGVAVPALALSDARTRWGTCSAAGRIRLNWRLVHLAPELADYVVVHELAHLREMNHSARFWRVVAAAYPQHRLARAELRRCNPLLPLL